MNIQGDESQVGRPADLNNGNLSLCCVGFKKVNQIDKIDQLCKIK